MIDFDYQEKYLNTKEAAELLNVSVTRIGRSSFPISSQRRSR
jgi:hypothetical protein